MIEIMIAIATLCTAPAWKRLHTKEVLQCQQYYVKCSEIKSVGSIGYNEINTTKKLAQCVLDKKSLGGSK